MGGDKWTVAGFLIVYATVRVIDWLLPGGHHFKFADRFGTKDKEEDTDEERP